MFFSQFVSSDRFSSRHQPLLAHVHFSKEAFKKLKVQAKKKIRCLNCVSACSLTFLGSMDPLRIWEIQQETVKVIERVTELGARSLESPVENEGMRPQEKRQERLCRSLSSQPSLTASQKAREGFLLSGFRVDSFHERCFVLRDSQLKIIL